MAEYSHKFRMKMVRRMVGPNAMSATALAAEVGIPQPTLSRWLRDARTVSPMTEHDAPKEPPAPTPRRPEEWTPEKRLDALAQARGLVGEALGAFLRRNGLRETDLDAWRQAALASLTSSSKGRRSSSDSKRIRQLESELRRKEKALAETAALLVLQGKVRALWGAQGDDTKQPSGKKS